MMADKRIFNFSAGPSMLPEEVLRTASEQMLNYKGSGMSVMEMSHRSSAYDQIIKEAQRRLRALLQIPDNYKVLFLQGGASTQFSAIPMNLLRSGSADYVDYRTFCKNCLQGSDEIWGDPGSRFDTERKTSAAFRHRKNCSCARMRTMSISAAITRSMEHSGNTCRRRRAYRSSRTCPVISCRERSMFQQYGLIFAGAQKNMGIAGVTVVIVREDLLGHAVWRATPTMLNYQRRWRTRIRCTIHRRPMRSTFSDWCWNG